MVLNQDVDLTTNIIFNLDDHQYFPYIHNLSNLDFNPSYDGNLILEKNLPYPIYSILYHSIFYKIFNIYGFIIIEFFIILIFFYLISSFLSKLGFTNNISIIIALLIFMNPFFVDIFDSKINYINSFREIYNLRIPRPSISSLYLFLFFNIILLNDKNSQYKSSHLFLLGIVFALLFSSFYYYLALSGLIFLIYYSYIKLKFAINISEILKDLSKIFISFLIFLIPILIILLNAEEDWLSRVGLIELNYERKIIIINHYLNKIFSLPFLVIFTLISIFWAFLKLKSFYNKDGINLLYFIFLSCFISPIIFTFLSPSISEIYHFSNMIVGITLFILFIFLCLIFNLFLKKVLNNSIIYISSIFVLLSFFSYMTFDSYKKKSFSLDMKHSNELIKNLQEKKIKKDTEILLFGSKNQVNLILRDHKNLSFVLGIYTPITDNYLEEKIIKSFYFLGLNEKNFINFFKNRREKGRGYMNTNVGKTFYMKYQANKIKTFENSKDFSKEELRYISKVPVLSNQQLIIPKFELNRLINRFNSYDNNKQISPKIIIINKNSDKFYKDIKLNADQYCKIDINKSYIVYFDYDTILKCE